MGEHSRFPLRGFPAPGEQLTYDEEIDGAARVYREARIRIETERPIAAFEAAGTGD